MPVGSFLALLDDITLQSKIAISRASGVVTDDLALNANMVTGIPHTREIPVVRAIATGSLINKFVLSAGALAISAFAPVWVIPGLLMVGGAYLCYEGAEKIQHMLGMGHKGHDADAGEAEDPKAMDAETYKAHEKSIIRSAIITDVVLSAEITALTLGGLNVAAPLVDQAGVLLMTGIGMTIGVYGLVAGIVKADDAGLLMKKRQGNGLHDRAIRATGRGILAVVPYVMKSLSYIGTAAMFIVGGGIFAHHIPLLHDAIHTVAHMTQAVPGVGEAVSYAVPLLGETVSGVVAGVATMTAIGGATFVYNKTVGTKKIQDDPEHTVRDEGPDSGPDSKPDMKMKAPNPPVNPNLSDFSEMAGQTTPTKENGDCPTAPPVSKPKP